MSPSVHWMRKFVSVSAQRLNVSNKNLKDDDLCTHDQEEALSIADKVVVMEAGRFRQVGGPSTSINIPLPVLWRTLLGRRIFSKDFDPRSGPTEKREFKISQRGSSSKEEVYLAVRPEKIEVFKSHESPNSLEPSTLFPAESMSSPFWGLPSGWCQYGWRRSDFRCHRKGF